MSRRRRVSFIEQSTELKVRFGYDAGLVDEIKRLPQRRWDGAERCWFVPAEYAGELLEILSDRGFEIDDAVLALATRGGRNARMRRLRRASRRDSLTPASLNARLADAVRSALPDAIWLIGEVLGWRERAGVIFFDLVEWYEGERQPRARLRARMFQDTWRRIEAHLASTRPPLIWRDGMVVRLKVSAEVFERSGSYNVRVIDIDPDYTITLMNERRAAALRVLDEAGISENNLDLPLPSVPLRIALLTSVDSEAAADFLDELSGSGLAFSVDLFDVRVQGRALEQTVLAALQQTAARAERYDVVAIIRGGGGRVDLSGFDLLSVGDAVCRHPLPVLAGIGHQRDHSLIDDVARSFKTPTAVGAALVELVSSFVEQLTALQGGIAQQASQHHRRHDSALVSLAASIAQRADRRLMMADRELTWLSGRSVRSAETALGIHRRALEGLRSPLSLAVRRRLEREGDLLDVLSAKQQAADPARILRRGFARVLDESGRTVRASAAVAVGDRLVVMLPDGRLAVIAEEKINER
ncbi:MAG: exodeoxyribonuclease VII large subunit [Myxococcota bacterium]|nr:exodeoxyribonuclease VII large subunit [Myxococcota bacterium]